MEHACNSDGRQISGKVCEKIGAEKLFSGAFHARRAKTDQNLEHLDF